MKATQLLIRSDFNCSLKWINKKMVVFYFLLMLTVGRCTDDQVFETKTVAVGEDVTLTCIRHRLWHSAYLFWIRVASGAFPEVLGGRITYDYNVPEETGRITAKQEPGTFALHITKAQLSDTAVYYCIKVTKGCMTFTKGIFLRIKGQEADITAVTHDFPSDPVRPGDSVSLQCSVLPDSENKTCPGGHGVFWFRARSDQSHPSLIYAHGNSDDECEKSPEAGSPQKCVYSFFKNVSSSDAGTYYCAVASCGQILFGNGAKLDIEVGSTCDLQNDNTIICLLCAALTITLIVIAFLLHTVRKKSCDLCNAAATHETNVAPASDTRLSQQRNEASLVYCTPNFTRRTDGKSGRKNQRKKEIIYTDVRGFVMDQQFK